MQQGRLYSFTNGLVECDVMLTTFRLQTIWPEALILYVQFKIPAASKLRNWETLPSEQKGTFLSIQTTNDIPYLNKHGFWLLRREIQNLLLRLTKFGRPLVMLLLFLLHAADCVFSESLQRYNDLVVRSIELKREESTISYLKFSNCASNSPYCHVRLLWLIWAFQTALSYPLSPARRPSASTQCTRNWIHSDSSRAFFGTEKDLRREENVRQYFRLIETSPTTRFYLHRFVNLSSSPSLHTPTVISMNNTVMLQQVFCVLLVLLFTLSVHKFTFTFCL